MKRVTRNGIQYIDGDIPVAESVFRQDPFNPVRHSAVADVIAETTSVIAYPGDLNREDYPAGIAVFDAQTDEDIQKLRRTFFTTCVQAWLQAVRVLPQPFRRFCVSPKPLRMESLFR